MKAITLERFGTIEELSFTEVPDLTLASGEVLIKSRASGLNGADLLQRQGLYPPPPGASPLLGLEVSGVIEKLDANAEEAGFKIGEEVMALLAGGGYASQVAVRFDQLMRVPPALDLVQAGGLVEVFVTAYLELMELGRLKQNERVLIHAGASGVGTAAIQIAKSVGAEVWVTAGSDDKLEFCRSLGADHMINYRTENFAERIASETKAKGVNCILDLVGASHFEKNLASLALDGRLLLVGLGGGTKTSLDLRKVLSQRIQIIGSTLRSRTLDEKALLIQKFWSFAEDKFVSGEFAPIVDKVFPAHQVQDAHRYMESQKNKGKIVLEWS